MSKASLWPLSPSTAAYLWLPEVLRRELDLVRERPEIFGGGDLAKGSAAMLIYLLCGVHDLSRGNRHAVMAAFWTGGIEAAAAYLRAAVDDPGVNLEDPEERPEDLPSIEPGGTEREAAEWRERYRASQSLQPGQGYAALKRADELIERFRHLFPSDTEEAK